MYTITVMIHPSFKLSFRFVIDSRIVILVFYTQMLLTFIVTCLANSSFSTTNNYNVIRQSAYLFSFFTSLSFLSFLSFLSIILSFLFILSLFMKVKTVKRGILENSKAHQNFKLRILLTV